MARPFFGGWSMPFKCGNKDTRKWHRHLMGFLYFQTDLHPLSRATNPSWQLAPWCALRSGNDGWIPRKREAQQSGTRCVAKRTTTLHPFDGHGPN